MKRYLYHQEINIILIYAKNGELFLIRILKTIKNREKVSNALFFSSFVTNISAYMGSILCYMVIGVYYLKMTKNIPTADEISFISYYLIYLINQFSKILAINDILGMLYAGFNRISTILKTYEELKERYIFYFIK